MTSPRHFDIVLLGATGYTGKLCAEHIVQNLPTNLTWAIAGRCVEKLSVLGEQLRKLDPERKEPEIVDLQLRPVALDSLAKRTKVILNCVGPYHLYSTPVVEACANNGTHYLDVTGEMPWVKEMIEKYHEKAKETGAIIISADGLECAPTDLLTWALVKYVNDRFSVHTKEVISSIYKLKTAGVSGGTFSTVIGLVDKVPLKELYKAQNPYYLSASQHKRKYSAPFLQQVLGVRVVPELGTMSSYITGHCDVAVVHRSSSLMPELYGPHFHFESFVAVRNALVAIILHISTIFGVLALTLPPVRWLVRKLIYAPGEGPEKRRTTGNRIEYRAIATAEERSAEGKPIKVLGTYKANCDAYGMTGVLLAESAMVLLTSERMSQEIKGGYLTPAMLGQEYIDRLDKVGITIQMNVLEA
ncbi:conserved hypothetical protein [Histoplasma capsulatum var. duboisii H88]|uniref:Saccharopine dehydrogenase n=2 Tax=Ajellomyces capsulatus TaxID=5037 RepID=F0UB49_AJEC8|nr:saccharopine dehydrogenase [Histoplasma capsulatum H143]EGC43803.1 conserved hypothetical protein [Histoplasma capsulatum var. duboisii H88]QSS49958.1 saccharopine dehydrogenase [Histoplasma capsulatum var. duboisii H88]